MSGELYSPRWHEFGHLRPALLGSLQHRRQYSRGRVWHILSGPGSRQQLRLNAGAWLLVGMLDGVHELDGLWHRLVARHGDAAPSQPETLELLAQLSEAGFLKADVLPDLPTRIQETRRIERRRKLAALSPLAMRIELFNPGRLLDRIAPWAAWLFTTPAMILWLGTILVSALAAASEWPALGEAIGGAVGSPRFVVMAWVVYPLMKCVHEIAHGLAIRKWHGVVGNAGITLLVLVPVPFVDASAANAFERRQRIVVSAAGVMTELLIAAAAFWVWLAVAPGLLRDLALTTFFIGAISSLLFNGNPLLRFDGYYVLADLIDLPNLASRSQRWWHARIGRHLFGASIPLLDTAPGEAKWLALYAPGSWCFQALIGYRIAGWLGGISPLLGVAVALLLIVTLAVLPLKRAIAAWVAPDAGRARSPARTRLLATAAALVLLVLALPLPSATTVPAVTTLPEQSRLTAQSGGFVAELLARDGDAVHAGELIARLEDPALRAEAEEARSRLAALETRRFDALLRDPHELGDLAQQIRSTESELAELETRIAALDVRAGADGELAIAHQDDLPGTYLPRGHTLGHVLQPGAVTMHAIVPHEDAARVRLASEAVSVRLASLPQRSLPAHVVRAAAGASHLLPSAALSERFGGPLKTIADDRDGLRTETAFFDVEVALDAPVPTWIGERARVRFAHPAEPLAAQWLRSGRQLLLQFGPGA